MILKTDFGKTAAHERVTLISISLELISVSISRHVLLRQYSVLMYFSFSFPPFSTYHPAHSRRDHRVTLKSASLLLAAV